MTSGPTPQDTPSMTSIQLAQATGDQRRLISVVFADVVGYSAMTAQNEVATHRLWMGFIDNQIRPLCEQYQHGILRTIGDAILVTFESVHNSVSFCRDLQQVLRQDRVSREPKFTGLSLRMAAHLCDAILEENDVYGDGVNITKRLQESAATDGVIISEAAFQSIRSSNQFETRSIGFLTMKNIPEPMRAYELVFDIHSETARKREKVELPSIAVMPFINLGRSDDDDYFAEGVVEDIIQSLSSLRELLVIARNSTINFTERNADPRDVGRILNVRYVLQGTIRRAANRIRVMASLSDAQDGSLIFSERCDFSHSDLFEIQDMITERIVARIAPEVRSTEGTKAMRKRPENFNAYDMTLRAIDLIRHLDLESLQQARVYLEKAMSLDPSFAMPFAWCARLHSILIGQGWSEDREADGLKTERLAQEAINLDRHNGMALAVYGHAKSFLRRDYETAMVFLDRAREVSPSQYLAWIHSSATLSYLGKGAEAVEHAEHAYKLSPYDTDLYRIFGFLCIAHFANDNFEEALRWARRSYSENERYTSNIRMLIASLVANGEIEEARVYVQRLMRLEPGFELSEYESHGCPFRSDSVRHNVLTFLNRAWADPMQPAT